MLKRILFLCCFIISSFAFSQKNEINIYPTLMSSTSGIIISIEKKGIYKLKILNSKKEVLFTKEAFIENTFAFKHDFSFYEKGKYIFILEKSSKEVFKTIKIK